MNVKINGYLKRIRIEFLKNNDWKPKKVKRIILYFDEKRYDGEGYGVFQNTIELELALKEILHLKRTFKNCIEENPISYHDRDFKCNISINKSCKHEIKNKKYGETFHNGD